jgi:hypothetical protein
MNSIRLVLLFIALGAVAVFAAPDAQACGGYGGGYYGGYAGPAYPAPVYYGGPWYSAPVVHYGYAYPRAYYQHFGYGGYGYGHPYRYGFHHGGHVGFGFHGRFR